MPVAAQATHRVHMEVVPLFAGHLPLPDVRLFKYLPHHSAHSAQPDAGKDRQGAGLRFTARVRCQRRQALATGLANTHGAKRGLGVGRACGTRPLSHFVCVLQTAG